MRLNDVVAEIEANAVRAAALRASLREGLEASATSFVFASRPNDAAIRNTNRLAATPTQTVRRSPRLGSSRNAVTMAPNTAPSVFIE